MQWQKYKNLDFLFESQGGNTCIVLFHGYGADAKDLSTLSQVYQFNKKVDWYFPQGVLEVPISPMMSGRAWFELRMADFEKVSQGEVDDTRIPDANLETLSKIVDWLNHLGKNYDQVIIGGFSQGAILTSHGFYRLGFQPAGLLLFSGFLFAPSSFPSLPPELCCPFFQSHGKQDTVLEFSGAKKLYDQLVNLGLKGEFHSFAGGHEIPMTVIQQSQTFLSGLLNP